LIRARRAPNASRSADPFHVVAWAIDALDIERRRAWNHAKGRRSTVGLARQGRSSGDAQRTSKSRYALWKNPSDLTGRQRHQLDWTAKTDPRLWRAYLRKEGLRYVFAVKGEEGKHALDRWIEWARRSRMPTFVELQRRIVVHRIAIDAALETGLSQGLVESSNTKIRLLTRIAFGFHGYQPLVALAMLALGSLPPQLPGRT
jgi:transposase